MITMFLFCASYCSFMYVESHSQILLQFYSKNFYNNSTSILVQAIDFISHIN